MKHPVPEEIKQLIRCDRVIFSRKAEDQLDYGNISIDDLYHSILHGFVYKKEQDEKGDARYKYVIIGFDESGSALIYSTGKIIYDGDKDYFIITFHEVR